MKACLLICRETSACTCVHHGDVGDARKGERERVECPDGTAGSGVGRPATGSRLEEVEEGHDDDDEGHEDDDDGGPCAILEEARDARTSFLRQLWSLSSRHCCFEFAMEHTLNDAVQ